MDAQQIYDIFHGSGAKGTSALEQAQHTSYTLADAYQNDAVGLQKLINDIGSAWTGQASDAASHGLAPLTEHLLTTGQDLNTHQDLVYRQANSFQMAAHQVRPVPPAPSMGDMIGAIAESFATGNPISQVTSMYDQSAHHNAVSTANVDAYTNYVTSSKYNSVNLPPMSGTITSTATTAPVTVVTGPQVAGRPAAATGARTAPRSTGGTAARSVHGSGPAGVPAAWQAPGNAAPVNMPPSAGGGATGTSGAMPPPVVSGTGPVTAPVIGAGGGNPPAQPVFTFPSAGGTGLPVDDGPSVGGATADIGARLAGGDNAPGEGAAAGSGNETPVGSGRAGVSPGANGGDIPGGRSASAPVDEEAPPDRAESGSATAAEEAMASERSGTAPGAVGPMGAGRGGRGDDGKHQRKVSLSADEDVFDDTDAVAVQVVGETYEQYQKRIAWESGQSR